MSSAEAPHRSDHERGGITTILVTLVVLLVAAGGAVYWFLIREDAKPKPKIVQSKTVAGGSVDGTWKLAAADTNGSFAQYRIGEQFAGGAVHTEATGRTTDVSGSMTVAGTRVSDVSVTANLGALKSDKDFRDFVIKDRGLETKKFPTATFTATAPITLKTAPAKGVTVAVPVTGDLTLHGVTKSVTVTLKGRWDGAKIQVIGDLPIKLPDYGITPPTSQLVAEVDDHGTLELNLFFTKAG